MLPVGVVAVGSQDAQAFGFEIADRFLEVLDADREMVEAVAAFGQKAANAALAGRGGRNQLDLLPAQLERGPAEPLGVVGAHVSQGRAPEDVDEQSPGGL